MKKHFFLIMTIALLLYGCAVFQNIIQQPTVEFDSVAMRDMTLFDGTAVFRFKVGNPNPVNLNLDGLTYLIRIDGRDFLNGDLKQGLTLPANGVLAVEVPIRINYMDFFNSIADFLKKDSLKYDLSGTFAFGIFNIPYSHQGDFTVPKLPKVSLKSAAVRKMSLAGADLILQLEMANDNPFAVALKNLDYGIKIGGVSIADGKTAAISPLTDQGRQVIEVPVHINFLTLGQTAYQLLNKGSAAYEVSGNMGVEVPELGIKPVPFTRSGQVDFSGR